MSLLPTNKKEWTELQRRGLFYQRWSKTPEAKKLRPPENYAFLVNHPNNFKLVREKFHVAWITYKMTEL